MKKIFYPFILILSISSGCAQKSDHVVTIKTNFGEMVAILYDETPKHKQNFLKLAREHYYDSLLFHRVMEGFMIQGGDPQSKNSPKGARLGNGGPNYTIEAEINPKLFHEKGALSAARLGDQVNPTKASSGSQFYIVQGTKYSEADLKKMSTDPQKFSMALQQFFQKAENKAYTDTLQTFYRNGDRAGYEAYLMKIKPEVEKQVGIKVDREFSPEMIQAYTTAGGAPHLDGGYTVFGKVIKGFEVIDKIASQPRDEANRPVDDVWMVITVEELPLKKIEKLYNYKYPEVKK